MNPLILEINKICFDVAILQRHGITPLNRLTFVENPRGRTPDLMVLERGSQGAQIYNLCVCVLYPCWFNQRNNFNSKPEMVIEDYLNLKLGSSKANNG